MDHVPIYSKRLCSNYALRTHRIWGHKNRPGFLNEQAVSYDKEKGLLKCDKCDYTTKNVRPQLLVKHQEKSENRIYFCDICSKRMCSKSALKAHKVWGHKKSQQLKIFKVETQDYDEYASIPEENGFNSEENDYIPRENDYIPVENDYTVEENDYTVEEND